MYGQERWCNQRETVCMGRFAFEVVKSIRDNKRVVRVCVQPNRVENN